MKIFWNVVFYLASLILLATERRWDDFNDKSSIIVNCDLMTTMKVKWNNTVTFSNSFLYFFHFALPSALCSVWFLANLLTVAAAIIVCVCVHLYLSYVCICSFSFCLKVQQSVILLKRLNKFFTVTRVCCYCYQFLLQSLQNAVVVIVAIVGCYRQKL